MKPLRILDLFAGLEGWSEPWREAGHDVCSVDIDPAFDVDLHADILELHPYDLPWLPDVILASPPCETFSLMSVGHHWTGDHLPKSEQAAIGYKLVDKTLQLCEQLAPQAWLLENPRAKLRSMPLMRAIPRTTVWYCHYELPFAKPTDLFGEVPGWKAQPECHNLRTGHGEFCCCRDHIASPRGSRTGIQGRTDENFENAPKSTSMTTNKAATRAYYGTSNTARLAAFRAKVPYALSYEVMKACEALADA